MTERYRVVVAFEAAADAAAATRQAIELAEQLRAELFGVFVEEVEALRLAALPFATLVDRSGRTSPLRPATVEAGWKSAASRAESNLSRAADRARIPASFGVARGRLLGALRSLSQGRDLILLGETRAPRAAGAGGGDRALPRSSPGPASHRRGLGRPGASARGAAAGR